ncbi:MAG: mechanosensitive ion channel family protein [Owenweeksia sp.]
MKAIDRIQASVQNYWLSFLDKVPDLILGMIILVLSFLVSRWIASFFRSRMAVRMDDPLLSNFLSRIIRYTLIILGILLAFHVMGLTGIAASLLAGAGVGALIIGFAFQDIGANFIAGVILAFNRPFNTGDTIEIDANMGKVVRMDLRTTQIKTFDGKDIYIPNNTIVKEELINYTRDGYIRLGFVVGIDYEDDVDLASEVILDATIQVKGVLNDQDRKPLVLIKELATSTINLEVRFWMETFDYKQSTLELRSKVMNVVLKALVKSGVGLPADILELKHYTGKGFPIRMVDDTGSEK